MNFKNHESRTRVAKYEGVNRGIIGLAFFRNAVQYIRNHLL
jgi:hypothetical protein